MRKHINHGIIARTVERSILHRSFGRMLVQPRYSRGANIGLINAVMRLRAIVDTETARKPQPTVHALIQHLHDQGHCLPHLAQSPSERVPDPVLWQFIGWQGNLRHCENHPITFQSYMYAWDYLRYLLNLMILQKRQPQTVLKLLCGWARIMRHATFLNGTPQMMFIPCDVRPLVIQIGHVTPDNETIALYPLVTPRTHSCEIGLMHYRSGHERTVSVQTVDELYMVTDTSALVGFILRAIDPVRCDDVLGNLQQFVQSIYLASGYTLAQTQKESTDVTAVV